ncbi:MAG: aminotransferase class I/II-fold pyridoxal phosphate-dependent enzyme [Anaerolineae bacterium]
MSKTKLTDLAVFDGEVAFEQPLHVGRPNIGDRRRLMERLDDMLDRRWLTNNGPFVLEFEAAIAQFLGVRHCVAMCNATIALEIAIRALGMTGEVIVPSFTFVATAHALQWQEITPVFADIKPGTHSIDPQRVEMMITPRTTGIVGVHVWGRPCDIDALTEMAERRRLRLLFDAAHAFGCSYKGRLIGGFGDAEVLSFHATKFLNTFEGGAVVTNDDDLAERIRYMRNFGFAGYDTVLYVGTNGKMNEVCAAMGLTSLESMDDFVATNHHNYLRYKSDLADVPGVSLAQYDEDERNNYQYIILEIDEAVTGVTRDQMVEILHAENVLARRYFYPGVHQMEPYRSYFPHAGLLLPETERLCCRALSLPTGTAVTTRDVAAICQIIRFVIENGGQVRQRLAIPSADMVPVH